MSAYSSQHFSVGEGGGALRIELTAHPDLPHLMLTLSMGAEARFTLAAPNEEARNIVRRIAALFEGPEIPSGETRHETAR